jgi:hypothetical protein
MPRINTPTENMRKFLDGYGRLVNKSDSPTGEGTSTLGTAVKTSSFTYNATTITLADKPKIYGSDGIATQGDLVALNSGLAELTAFGVLGNVDYTNGYVTIYENVIPTSTTISVLGYPRYKDTVTIKNELLLNVVATVTN